MNKKCKEKKLCHTWLELFLKLLGLVEKVAEYSDALCGCVACKYHKKNS